VPGPSKSAAAEIARDCFASKARRLDRVLTRIYDGALRSEGVTGAQLEMLVAIALAGPTSAAWAGRRLELEKSSVSRTLARLEEAGWITSEGGLRVTPRGTALIERCHPLWRRAQEEAGAVVGAPATRLL
jgi:DNA-binding MarR family transcriptional regulator